MTNVKWFGAPGHFICADQCRFHLCTQVGEYLISTVGEMFPDSAVREIFAESRGVQLKGMGDERKYDYMKKIGFEKLGYDRLYETMVFKAGKPCDSVDCGCGLPAIDGNNLDFAGYNTARDATEGHAAMVALYIANQALALPPELEEK